MSKKKADRADRVPFGKLLAWQTRPISLGRLRLLSDICQCTVRIPWGCLQRWLEPYCWPVRFLTA